MRVLFVEDEKLLAGALKHLFENQNISADVAYDGPTGNILANSGEYDVIVLDVMLPGGLSGLDILKNLRDSGSKQPVLMLTAKDSLEDKVNGLNLGADDYLVKPFESEELIARVNALNRRAKEESIQKGEKEDSDGLVVLEETSEILVGDKTIPLTAKEMDLLKFLMKYSGHPKSKADILSGVWGNSKNITENSVELYIHYLRKKLENSKIQIRTIRGQGYLLQKVL